MIRTDGHQSKEWARLMKIVIVLSLLVLVSCEGSVETRGNEAISIYRGVQRKEIPDSTGRAYFRRMTYSQANRLSDYFQEKVRELESRARDPEEHIEAHCSHPIKFCRIMNDMKETMETHMYMIEARTPFRDIGK